MDQPWRFPQAPGSLHPTVRPPQFPFPGDVFPHPSVYRPAYGGSPFVDLPCPPSPFFPHRPHATESWNGYSVLERDELRHQLPNDALYRHNFPKRMRYDDEIRVNSEIHIQPDFRSRSSFEDARRLNLIKDHGRPMFDAAYHDPSVDSERRDRSNSFIRASSSSGSQSFVRKGQPWASLNPQSHGFLENLEENVKNYDIHRYPQQIRAQSPTFITQAGPRGILDRRQQFHQALNSESRYPSANISPNPSVSILGRYHPTEHDVHRQPEMKYDAYANDSRSAQNFEPKPSELSDAVPVYQMHQFAVENCTNMTAPSLNSSSLRGLVPPQTVSQKHHPGSESVPHKHAVKDKRTIVNASHIFCKPHRSSRPEHIVVILRGLPGSGKSYLAKALRDLEVDNGGTAPRIHCIDDYFMSEVETVEDNDVPKSAGSVNGKEQVHMKLEYCYEPEMEEAYRSSMLKTFKKTVEDRIFSFAIVDDRNLRVADFAQFWSIGKRSGYEVYLVEAPYKDPAGCAARNIHGFTLEDIKGMADRWEEAPPFYLQLDIQALFSGDDLQGSNIQEVEMDMEDAPHEGRMTLEARDEKPSINGDHAVTDDTLNDESLSTGERWALRKSKWSEDLDDEDVEEKKTFRPVPPPDSLPGLLKVHGNRRKFVRWGDQIELRGFSIGAKQSISALIIGPGPGYNLGSNPPTADEAERSKEGSSRKKSSLFLDNIRAERESFRAIFDRRRQRIGGFDDADDDYL